MFLTFQVFGRYVAILSIWEIINFKYGQTTWDNHFYYYLLNGFVPYRNLEKVAQWKIKYDNNDDNNKKR